MSLPKRTNPRTVHVIGLDISLSRTGVAVLGCTPRDEWTTHAFTVPTAPGGREAADQLDRMNRIAATVADTCAHADLVVIEGGAYASRTAQAHTLAGCWWIVYSRIVRREVPVVVVPPKTLKKYITGSGNAGKLDVAVTIARLWPEVELTTSDACDALGLACIGAALMRLPVPWPETKYRTEVLAGLPRSDESGAA